MSGSVLELVGVVQGFGDRTVLDRIDLTVARGSTVALMGANGAGKSTLLDLVCGLTRPRAGWVRVDGTDAHTAVRTGRVGAMLQSGGLLPDLNVGETLGLFVELFDHRVDRDGLLDEVGLAALRDRRVGACSGGEQQRLRWAIARASDPDLLVLDEPTAGMDWLGRHEFWEQVRALTRRGCTVLYSSHYADEVEAIADRVLLLSGGRLVVDAGPGELTAAGDGRFFDGLARRAGQRP